jgi:hypothetical protein
MEAIQPLRSKIRPINRPAEPSPSQPPTRSLRAHQPPPLLATLETARVLMLRPTADDLFLHLRSCACTVGSPIDQPTTPELLPDCARSERSSSHITRREMTTTLPYEAVEHTDQPERMDSFVETHNNLKEDSRALPPLRLWIGYHAAVCLSS